MTPVRVARRDLPGPRVWILGVRVHHGLVGVLALTAGVVLRRGSLAALGALAVWHDAPDFPWPLRERLPLS